MKVCFRSERSERRNPTNHISVGQESCIPDDFFAVIPAEAGIQARLVEVKRLIFITDIKSYSLK